MRIGIFILHPHAVVENCTICHVSGIKWCFCMHINLLLDVNISYGHAMQAFIY